MHRRLQSALFMTKATWQSWWLLLCGAFTFFPWAFLHVLGDRFSRCVFINYIVSTEHWSWNGLFLLPTSIFRFIDWVRDGETDKVLPFTDSLHKWLAARRPGLHLGDSDPRTWSILWYRIGALLGSWLGSRVSATEIRTLTWDAGMPSGSLILCTATSAHPLFLSKFLCNILLQRIGEHSK